MSTPPSSRRDMFNATWPAQDIAASTSWQSPTPTLFYMAPSPTGTLMTVTDVQVLPFSGAPTAAASGTPVVIDLHAEVTIQHYDNHYQTPPPSFRYHVVDDGSLLTDAYTERIAAIKAPILIAGALLVFFLRNARNSLVFLRRIKVKDKTLFYLLASSQVLGLAGAVVDVVGLLDTRIGCVPIDIARMVLMKLSSDTMITGIIGTKAYRCMGNNRLILLFLLVMTTVMWSLEGLHLASYMVSRSLYGVCQITSDVKHMYVNVWAEFVQSTVLCACFLFATWKSCNMRTNTRGTTTEASEYSERDESKDVLEDLHYRRGWRDIPDVRTTRNKSCWPSPGFMQPAFTRWIRRLWSSHQLCTSSAYERKPSQPGEYPFPKPPRRPSPSPASSARRAAHICWSSVVSAWRKWGRHASGRQLYQKMLRNELLYTTMIAVIFMVMAIVLLVGIHRNVALSSEEWIIVNWVIVSLCTMHSFARVVRRNELESVLQHPAAWDRILQTDTDFSKIFYGSTARLSRSSQGSSSRSPSPPDFRLTRPGGGLASFRHGSSFSEDSRRSSYTISPLTPSGSRKPSYASNTITSLPYRHRALPLYDSPPRSPTPDMLYAPAPNFSSFSFGADAHHVSPHRLSTLVPPRPKMDLRKYSFNAWAEQRATIDWTELASLRKNSC